MPDGQPTLEELAQKALAGDRYAVSDLVRALSGDIYGLALRMLWHREDAEDATQEILVRVVTRLSQFDFRSQLKTWVYRVATHYLLDVKKSPVEQKRLSFRQFGEDLATGLSTEGPRDDERSILVEEVKLGCTLGMLQCLDRPSRLAYVLGEILELPAGQAASALAIEPATFRKRLQRARERIEDFTRKHCGIVSDEAVCQCNRRVPAAVQLGRANADSPAFATATASFLELKATVRRVDAMRRALELHRTTHPRASTTDFARRLASALEPDNAEPE
jgi:RNA polymerase sigma factor (sigma-70 family)